MMQWKVNKWDPYWLYLFISFNSSMFFSLVFTVNILYQITVANLNPLQLVLLGTILEAAIFIFEIPTGVLADLKSRKLSIVVGYFLIGVGFLIEGLIPEFYAIAIAQLIWGIGYTFISGASQAWIADELGEERVGKAFLKGAQYERIGDLFAIPISILLGLLAITYPIIIGGGMMIVLALFLLIVMPENGFQPTDKEERNTWSSMLQTVKEAKELIQYKRIFLVMIGIAIFYGLYSEGFDRLWTTHLVSNFTFPEYYPNPVVIFGVLRAVMLIISIIAVQFIEKYMEGRGTSVITRLLITFTILMIIGLLSFGLVKNIWIAILIFWSFSAFRNIVAPIFDIWFNLQIKDPNVRATMFSIRSLTDAVGQIAGGPGIGFIGKTYSIRAAIITAGIILAPILFLYQFSIKYTKQEQRNG